ncbi:MAG: DUF6324 family protein [Gemmobacter sp.]
MGKDDSDIAGNLRIGPTTLGMVRISVEAEGIDLPLDFDPEDAEEIAEELRAAADAARRIAAAAAAKPAGKSGLKPRR